MEKKDEPKAADAADVKAFQAELKERMAERAKAEAGEKVRNQARVF